MKFYLLIIFFLLRLIVIAQVVDDFNDGDFTNSPSWSGNDSDFNVNTSGQLQLNATTAGNSFLSLAVNLSSLDSCEWHFYIHLDFSPSTSNYSRVYISSDQSDLQQSLNGYYVQFGEALSNDAVELFRQNGATRTSICRAQNGQIANSFSAGVKVQRSNSGLWTISVDYSGGTNYITEATGMDTTFNSAGWIGINCVYTSGNINKFSFDDFYAGHEIPDTVLPEILNVNVESDSVLSIAFSEKMDSISIYNLNNYLVDNGIGQPSFIEHDNSDLLKYFIHFSTSFRSGLNYTISFSGLKDVAQNRIIAQNRSFIYSPVAAAKFNDIVFSEIYFEPKLLSPLPDAEYVEVFNRSDSSILLTGWRISDGSSDGLIPSFRLGPHEYLLLRSENDSIDFLSIPNAVAVHSFPTLNNDVGDHLQLSDQNSKLISEIQFNDDYYHDSHKNDGGWSIERVDPDFTCINENNWKASVSNLHGTPGSSNSVNGIFSDHISPFAVNAFLSDSNKLTVIFSETVFEGVIDVNNYNITSSDGRTFVPSLILSHGDTAELQMTSPFWKGIYILKISSAIKDCPGNEFESDHTLKFGFSENAVQQDIIINELLFDSYDGGNDFLEIFNRSQKIIDLKDWRIAEADYNDSTDVKENVFITRGHRLLFPGEFLVLTEDEKRVKSFYNCENMFAFLNVNSMPDFNSEEGRAIMYDNDGNAIDEFQYAEEIHFPLLAETRGVSLERLSTEQINIENINWHSAAATVGFATPGFGNSQQLVLASGSGEVSLGVEIFSPDDDGYNDLLLVRYDFPQNGTMLSLNVYDCNGQQVRKLLSGETVSNEGVITWDGLTDEHQIADAGIYILLAKSFDLDGNDKVFKRACFLTRKY